jgi:hypothetical protein
MNGVATNKFLNMVTFQVWKDGQDPNTHVPYGTLPATIEGGKAIAKWLYNLPSRSVNKLAG